MTVPLVINVAHMRRSGGHACLEWIFRSILKSTPGVCMAFHQGNYVRWKTLKPARRIWGGAGQCEVSVMSYEDYAIEDLLATFQQNKIEADFRINILVIRDIYNMVASRCRLDEKRRTQTRGGLMPYALERWREHAEEAIRCQDSDCAEDEHMHCVIRYPDIFDRPAHTEAVCRLLYWQDGGYDSSPVYGSGGSSFTGMREPIVVSDIRNRFRQCDSCEVRALWEGEYSKEYARLNQSVFGWHINQQGRLTESLELEE